MNKDKEYWYGVKSRAENISGSTTIISGKSQFRGNTVNMWTINNKDQEEITVANTYYMGSVHQTYLINDCKTTVKYSCTVPAPKWLRNRIANNKSIRIQMKDMYCTFSAWEYTLCCTAEKEGLMFNGNIDNISTLKELKRILSSVRSIVKKYSYETLTELVSIKDLNDYDLVITYYKLLKYDRDTELML